MSAYGGYILSMFVMFTLWGGVWYAMDRAMGVSLRNWFYNITHDQPRPKSQEKGFLYLQNTKTRFAWATVLSTVQSVIVILQFQSINFIMELPAWFLEVWFMLLGMKFLGPIFFRLSSRSDEVFERLDHVLPEREGSLDPQLAVPAQAVLVEEKPEAELPKEAAPAQLKQQSESQLDPIEAYRRYVNRK